MKSLLLISLAMLVAGSRIHAADVPAQKTATELASMAPADAAFYMDATIGTVGKSATVDTYKRASAQLVKLASACGEEMTEKQIFDLVVRQAVVFTKNTNRKPSLISLFEVGIQLGAVEVAYADKGNRRTIADLYAILQISAIMIKEEQPEWNVDTLLAASVATATCALRRLSSSTTPMQGPVK